MHLKITPSSLSTGSPGILTAKSSLRLWRNFMVSSLLLLATMLPEISKAVIVTFGTAYTTSSFYVGINTTSYRKTHAEAVFLASEIGSAGNITSYALSKGSGTSTTTIDSVYIYMKESSATSITTTASLAGYTLVYKGNFPNSATSGWMTATFPTAFPYTGTGNLHVLVARHSASTISSGPNYHISYSSTGSYSTGYQYSTSSTASYWSGWAAPTATATQYTYNYYRPHARINIDAFSSCTGTPTAGTAVASTTTACPGASVRFSLSGSTLSTGISYSWDTSATGTGGWATAGTSSSVGGTWLFVPPSGRTLFYRCNLTCSAGGSTVTSSSLSVSVGTATTVPYSENFESGTAGVNMPCANALPSFDPSTSTSGGSSGATWRLLGSSSSGLYTAAGPRSGSKYLWTGYNIGSYSGSPDGYWFTPGITLTTGNTYRFSYWYRVGEYVGTYYTSPGIDFGMYYGTSNTTASGLTAIKPDLMGRANMTHAENSGDFTVSANGVYYLAVKVNNKSYSYYGGGAIDDIGLIALPPCNTATTGTFGTGGKAAASPNVICSTPGNTTLSVTGTPAFSGLTFLWEEAIGSPSAGFTSTGLTAMSSVRTIATGGTYFYRCKVSCAATGLTTYSDTVKVITAPITPPYVEDFEGGTPGTNLPCAGYTSSWSSGAYWNLAGAPYASYAPGIKNRTTGGSKYLHAGYYLGIGTASDEYWFTPGLALTAAKAYNVSFWYSNSAYSTSYASYGTDLGVRVGTAQTKAAMTMMVGKDTTVYINASMTPSYDKLTRGFIAPTTGTYYVGIKVNHSYYNYYGMAIDDIGVDQLPPCAAKPSAGTTVATPSRICTSGSTVLSLSGTSLASDLAFQWYEIIAGVPTPIAGATSLTYTTPTITTGPKFYRCVVTCSAIGAPNTDTSTLLRIDVGPLDLPYLEDFETATPGVNQPCASYTTGWDATASTGGMFAYWGIKGTPGVSYPTVKNRTTGGSKYLSAGYYLSSMYMGAASNNQYWFTPGLNLTAGMAYKCNYWYVNGYTYYPTSYGLYYGTAQTAAAMTAMRPDVNGTTNTAYREIEGTFVAPTTGVYYVGVKVNHDYGYYGSAVDDIGVVQLPLCSAKPTAGTVDATPSLICSSGTAKLSLLGMSMASMLNFQWQDSSAASGGLWVNSTGATATTASHTTVTLSAPRWYRCIVRCPLISAPNVDTTPTYLMNVGAIVPPYKETFEKGLPGVKMPCTNNTYTWGAASSTLYWTLRGSSYTGYITVGNHTPSGSNFLWAGYYLGVVSGGDEFWFTPAISLTKDSTYEFSYWYLGSGYPSGGNTTLGMYYGTAQTKAAMTTAITPDLTGVNTSTYQQFIGRFIAPSTANYFLGIKVRNITYSYYGLGIDDIGLDQLPSCTGIPTAGAVSAKPSMLCTPGGSSVLNMDLAGVSKVAGLTYRWYEFPAMVPVSATLTSPTFTATGLTTGKTYVCVVKCSKTGDSVISSKVKVDVGAIIPPYIEDFETATPGVNQPCASYSTSPYWGQYYYWNTMNAPISYGPSALDNHTTGGSKYLISGYYIGYSAYSGYTEDFWITPAITLTAGKLYQASYWYKTDGYAGVTYKTAMYMGSTQTKAGMTTLLGSIVNPSTSGYKMYKHQFVASASGNFYFGIMKGQSTFGYGMSFDDIGIQEVPPCSSSVAAGRIVSDPFHVCASGGTTMLDLDGSSLATGLTYEWFSSTSPAGPFTSTGGTSLPYTTDPLIQDTWFKAVVTCTATGATDTTAAVKVGVGAFEVPYKEDFEGMSAGDKPVCSDATYWGLYDYDGFKVKSDPTYAYAYNNTPGGKNYLAVGYYLGYYGYYSTLTDNNFWFTPGVRLDTRYKYKFNYYYVGASNSTITVSSFYGKSQSVAGMTTALQKPTTLTGSYEMFDTTIRPATNGIYYFGLKKTNSPLGSYYYTNVGFDDINVGYAPCDGTPFVGAISSANPSNTALCVGTPVQLVNIGSATKLVPGIKHQWQRKPIGGVGPFVWTNVVGATDTILSADTLVGFEYRFAVVCSNTNDSVFSASFLVPQLPPHPAVTINPNTTPVTYCLGDSVKFSATFFTGAVYDWMLDSLVIPGWKFNDIGATEPGTYMVRVSSALSPCPGWSNKVTLVVNDPGYSVSITKPADSIICAGNSMTLTATGSKGGLTYQWRKNNVDIPGATSASYVVTTGGYYRVMAFDGTSSCQAASRNINIIVKPNPPAVISIPGGTATACENEGVQLNANTGGFSYEWTRGGSTIFGWTDSSQVIKNSGIYAVKVRSVDGCVSVSSSVTVNILPSPTPLISKSGLVLSTTGVYTSYQWVRNGVDIGGAIGTIHNLTKNGVYQIRVKDGNGCEGLSNPISVMEQGLTINNPALITEQLKIYPNPTSSVVYIQSPVAVQVSVKDVTGKTIYEARETKEIDLSKYADGIYLFTISDKDGVELIKQQRVTKFSEK